MRESFLHFIWQFQKLDTAHLQVYSGETLQVFAIGQYNTDAGPDFLNAKLMIDDITWYGHIELHLKSSDWKRHQHQHDKNYNNVVLHVVWEHDMEIENAEGQHIPVLELNDKIQSELLKKCDTLIKSPAQMPCAGLFDQVENIQKWSMLSQTGVKRLKNKSAFVQQLQVDNNDSWEETTFQLLAKNFGFKTNEHPFLKLAKIIGQKTLTKYIHAPLEIEALLFGVAGFLTDPVDEYSDTLREKYNFLSKKYQLVNQQMRREEWKFLRMRPSNFPTIRLAEFAAFLSANSKNFTHFIHYEDIKALCNCFKSKLPKYWTTHYDFGKTASRTRQGIGMQSIDVLLINTVAPLLATYARATDNMKFMDKATDLLQAIKPEQNSIVHHWKTLGLEAKDAFDTQAMISLSHDFCKKKKCLACKIGVSIINQ